MTDEMPDVDGDWDETAGVEYMTTLGRMEASGERTVLSMGPLAAVNLLVMLEFAARAPGPGQESHQQVVAGLAGQLADADLSAAMVDPDPVVTARVMRELSARERAGERAAVVVGPFTAMLIIGMLQLVTRHPELDGAQREMVRGFGRLFEPLFAGTFGEELVRRGYHPEWDGDV